MDSGLVGRHVDDVAFDVERGKIQEFAKATYATDPIHTDRDLAHTTGHPDVLATPTHVVVAGHHRDQRGFVRDLGLTLERVVVGSVKWEYIRPVRAGDRLHGSRTVIADERSEGKRGGSMRLVTLQTDYVDGSGVPVARLREVLIERGEQ